MDPDGDHRRLQRGLQAAAAPPYLRKAHLLHGYTTGGLPCWQLAGAAAQCSCLSVAGGTVWEAALHTLSDWKNNEFAVAWSTVLSMAVTTGLSLRSMRGAADCEACTLTQAGLA